MYRYVLGSVFMYLPLSMRCMTSYGRVYEQGAHGQFPDVRPECHPDQTKPSIVSASWARPRRTSSLAIAFLCKSVKMAGTFLETYTRDVSLCDHCGHSVHLQLDVPPSASENSILRDNRELSVVDMKKAEEGLLEMENALLQLEKAQDALQVASRHIQEVAHELKSRREVHRAYLAPIRRLSEELLLEIMRHSCEGGSQLEGDEPMPLVLTSVCKTWRGEHHQHAQVRLP